MNERLATRSRAGDIVDCWNRIGVHGDSSCPELTKYIHCRNCPVYAAGAARVLDADAPGSYIADRTAHFAQPAAADDGETRSVIIFRVESEWLALPTSVLVEVAKRLPIHSLPHRPNGVVLGLASIRGELLVCVSISQVVGAQPIDEAWGGEKRDTAYRRLLVIRRDDLRVVCPVDEVYGIHRFHPREFRDVPATNARATVTYSTSVVPWRGHSVGALDDELLFYTLRRSLG